MERRHWYGTGVGLAGFILAGIQAVHGLQQSDGALVWTFEAGPFVLVGGTLTYTGYWLATAEGYERDLPRVLAWGVGSTALFGSLAALMLFSQRVSLGTLDRSAYIAVDLITVGAVVGIVVGLYDARGRRRLRQVRRQRDRIESFANTAADVNNYGRALNRSRSVDEVSALCIEAMQALLGLSEVAVLSVGPDGSTAVDNTILGTDAETLAPLAAQAREGDQASVVSHGDPTGLAEAADATALSILLTERGDAAFVVVAVVPGNRSFDDEDVQLVELLASHAGTALDRLEGRPGAESTPRE